MLMLWDFKAWKSMLARRREGREFSKAKSGLFGVKFFKREFKLPNGSKTSKTYSHYFPGNYY